MYQFVPIELYCPHLFKPQAKIIVDGIFFYLLSIKTFSQRPTGDYKMSFLELADVVRRTSLSRPTIYRKMRAGAFPQKRKISERRVAWLEEEIDEWIKNKAQQ